MVLGPNPAGERHDSTSKKLLRSAWNLLAASLGVGENGNAASTDFKLLEQIKATDVARHAQLSTGAFYNRWPDRETFVDDMLDFSLSTERSKAFDKVIAVARSERDKGSSLRRLIEETSRADVESIAEDPAFAVQMYLWSSCRAKPEIRARLNALYEKFGSAWVDLYQVVLDEFGLEVRKPFELRHVDAVFSALVEGLAVQRVIGRDLPDELFTSTVLALVMVLACKPGDERSISDLWDSMDRGLPNDSMSLLQNDSLQDIIRHKRRTLRALMAELQSIEGDLASAMGEDE